MRRSLIVLACLVAAVLGSASAMAANVHFKSGPTFTDNGLTLTASGSLAGLGNGDVVINLSASGQLITNCVNPAGHIAPGQYYPRVTITGSQSIPVSEVKNGNVSFSVTTAAPGAVTPKQAGCPNNNWSVVNVDVRFASATISVVQGGKTVLSASFGL